METEITTWSESLNEGQATLKQVLGSKELNKSKSAGLWASQSKFWEENLTIWRESFLKL